MTEPESAAAAVSARVKSLFIYPIKSCRGISVSEASLSSTGFRWDRQWMVISSKGRAITQRVEPTLALIEVELPTEAFCEGWEPSNNSYLVVRAPGMDVLKVPLSKPRETSDGVSLWDWSGSAFDEGDEPSKWFSSFLQKPCHLVRFNEVNETRAVDPNYAHGYKIMFSDATQFLILSQESLDELNKLLKEPVSANRFRPNILVDGCEPFSEDLWKEININKLTFHSVLLCYRCKRASGGDGSGNVARTFCRRGRRLLDQKHKERTVKDFDDAKMLCWRRSKVVMAPAGLSLGVQVSKGSRR